MTAYRTPPDITDDELRALIAHDRRGKRRHQLERLELVSKSQADIDQKMKGEHQERGTGCEADMTRYDLRYLGYRMALQAAHTDPYTLQSTGERYTAAELLETWVKPNAGIWNELHEKVPGYPSLGTAKSKPAYALGMVLREGLGLGHAREGKNAAGLYKLKDSDLEVQKDWLARRAHFGEGQGARESLYLDKGFSVPETAKKGQMGKRVKKEKGDSKTLYINKPTVPSVPSELDSFFASYPSEHSAADLRAIALTDYAASKPDAEQNVTFTRLEHTLLGRKSNASATDEDLLIDAAALYLATSDPNSGIYWCLKTARWALTTRKSEGLGSTPPPIPLPASTPLQTVGAA